MQNNQSESEYANQPIRQTIRRIGLQWMWLCINITLFVLWNSVRVRYILSLDPTYQISEDTLPSIMQIDSLIITFWMPILLFHILYVIVRSIYAFAVIRSHHQMSHSQNRQAFIKEKTKRHYQLTDDGEAVEVDFLEKDEQEPTDAKLASYKHNNSHVS